ncbi:MAG: hypothetical protein ACK5MU_02930 [Candidatus Saccharimonadales bacterium]
MIQVLHGDDRIVIQKEVERILGDDYEILDGENLNSGDLDSIFLGGSLFATNRKILIKDLSDNADCFARLASYVDTEHDVVIWGTKLDKRTVAYKDLVAKKISIREFKVAEAPEKKLVFDVFDLAWRGQGKQAVALCEKIETTNDPYMFFGLMVSQATKKLESGQPKAAKILKLMSSTDLDMKTTSLDCWLLIKSLLLRVAEII